MKCPNSRPIVLLLEEVHLRAHVSGVLGRADFDVIEVGNSAEALETLEVRADVDVLLADIDLSGGEDGLELSRNVHERWPELGLVLTSERVRHLSAHEVPGDGCFLPHPVPTDTLLVEVRQAAGWP